MSLGNSLFNARKKSGLSQEEVAGRLGVSRQTISKWELDETLPDIRQSKKLANLYGLSLDELIEFDMDVKEIQDAIDWTSDAVTEKIDWTKAWSKKYPILAAYQNEVETQLYETELNRLLEDLEKKYGYNDLDAFLVLKEICWPAFGSSEKAKNKRSNLPFLPGSLLRKITLDCLAFP